MTAPTRKHFYKEEARIRRLLANQHRRIARLQERMKREREKLIELDNESLNLQSKMEAFWEGKESVNKDK